MDKLKPILAQKFWILFSLVLIMPLVGYFMTKGKLAAAIDDRWKKLDGAFTSIPAGTGVPNDSWTNKLNEIYKQQELHNRHANQELWVKQKERMFWPKDVAPIMVKAEYFKDLTEQQKGDQVLYKYPQSYQSQIRALWEIVDPLDDEVNLRDSDKRRKVAFAMADLHLSKIANLGNLQPTFSDIWEAQEDIWLQTELLQAIRRMNANGISQGDAFVKQLGKIQLFGGVKAASESDASTEGGITSGAMMSGGGDVAGIFGAGGFSGQRTESSTLSVDIPLAEEFVVATESSGGGNSASMASFSSGAGGFTDAGAGIGGGGGGGEKSESNRYIDFVETQPYKRRGFYIKLVMDHRKVPDLLAELMNSPFPVEIVRVQQVWLSDSGSTSESSGGGMMSGGMMSGGGGLKSGGTAGGPMSGGGAGFVGFKPPPASGGLSKPADGGGSAGFTEDGGAGLLGNMGTGGAAGRAGLTGSGSAAAMADPHLAQVAILGVWTLYLPPPTTTDAGQTTPPNSAAPVPGLAATPENSTSPAETTAEAATADSKPTTAEPTEGNGDEAKKPDDPDATKSEPAKPEKAESDTDKPTADKTPPKAEAGDKSDSETK